MKRRPAVWWLAMDSARAAGRHSTRRLLAIGVIALAALGAFVWRVVRAQAVPTGVVPIVWDKEACGYCRMHIGEPSAAAQLQREDGTVVNFDDPGCLMSWLDGTAERPRAIYFHHIHEDAWLQVPAVRFVRVERTPMGFGLGAVAFSDATAMTWEQARDLVRQRGKGGH